MELSKSKDTHLQQSPRKRNWNLAEHDILGSLPKKPRHRLSMDSYDVSNGSNSSHLPMGMHSPLLRGPSTPFSHYLPSPPRLAPAAIAVSKANSSFSIDSLISNRRQELDLKSSNPNSSPVRPVPLPPTTTSRPSAPSPPLVPISPYTSRSIPPSLSQIDPHLAHLAGVAADPRLGLSPSLSSVMQNPYYAAHMSQLAVTANLFRQLEGGVRRGGVPTTPSPPMTPLTRVQTSSASPVRSSPSQITSQAAWIMEQHGRREKTKEEHISEGRDLLIWGYIYYKSKI